MSRAEFGALWISAEQRCAEQATNGVSDWYAAGVAATCEWLAAAVLRPVTGAPHVAYSPATGRTTRANEELIDAECVAAERLAARWPRPPALARRSGWIEGVLATLAWAWRHEGPVPLREHVAAR